MILAEPLRWMITDLFEPHEERQNHPAPLDSVLPFLELIREFFHRLLIQSCLSARELAERFHLGFFRQVLYDRFVRFQTAQNIGTDQVAKRPVRIVFLFAEAFDKASEFFAVAKQARIDEVEDRPKIAKPVLNRSAGQCDSGMSFEVLHQMCLFGGGILDCLCLVDYGELPWNFQKLGNTPERIVTGDD